ncbi:Fpg/Nei family DNA glycosylase [Janibacter alkaliphilus]|uniref:DNA-(apurinic or apyrimidinic site) lyase n=1 Tax=Janibacter alkaliphilus TaxID=1069963 RepID=A0A852WYL7_9MICO|nr:endonuclease-8 [Janibacter alkaliphilus]
MPEGHTLHRIARDLGAAFVGTTPEVTSPQGRFAAGAALLSGREVLDARANGKHLVVEHAGEALLHVHLGLIGTFTIDATAYVGERPVVGQVRCRIATDEHVADLRGPNVCEVITPEDEAAIAARLGPDPLRADADPDRAWARIHRSSKPLAALLMDQQVLAGVGNVYRCEVLFRHRLAPYTPGTKVKRRSWEAVWDDLVRLLPLGVATSRIVTLPEQVEEVEAALARGEGVHLDERSSYVYKRTDQPCRVCGSTIRSAEIAGRTLYWCGRCQRRT